MILYPTETIYALGVNALDDVALAQLFALKGRDERQTVSWAVRDMADIEYYAEVDAMGRRIIERWLPGSLTVVLPAKDTVPPDRRAHDRTIGFRILPDPVGSQVVADFMATHGAPLTCTSANVSGQPTQATVSEIKQQFITAGRADRLQDWHVYDDGSRAGAASTVVRVIDGEVTILRAGAIVEDEIIASIKEVR